LAKKCNASFFETSAKEAINVEAIFRAIALILLSRAGERLTNFGNMLLGNKEIGVDLESVIKVNLLLHGVHT
jgi:hypothetical protein